MPNIKHITATEILDSRGNPTLETTVVLEDGTTGISSVPSGSSIGKFEAVELRDGDSKRHRGKGVLKAVSNVNDVIAPKIIGLEASEQKIIDKTLITLDGTPNKSKLGANALLCVSQAVCKAAAISTKMPLYRYINSLAQSFELPTSIEKMPTCVFNLINGGKHADNNLDIQEFFIIPPTSTSYKQGLELGVNVYNTLRDILTYKNVAHSLGDEGGFAPNFGTNLDALEILKEATDKLNIRIGYDAFLGIDAASQHFKTNGSYKLKDRQQPYTTSELINYFLVLNEQYKLLLLEDPMGEDDWEGWSELNNKLGGSVIIVGDDLVCTNPARLKLAVEKKAVTGVVIKPNQIGTITETLNVIDQAKKAGFVVVVSHRSGETNDTFIADFAVGVASDYVKFGAPARGERVAKYNRLLEIEHELVK